MLDLSPLTITTLYIIAAGIWTASGLNSTFFLLLLAGVIYWWLNRYSAHMKHITLQLKNRVPPETPLAAMTELKHRVEELQVIEQTLRISEERTHRQNVYLELLHETTLGLINRLDLDDLLTAIVKRAGELLNTSHGYVYLVEPDHSFIEIKVGVGLYTEKISQRRICGQGLCGKVWQQGIPISVENYQVWPGRIHDPSLTMVHSAIGVPLKSGHTVIGVLGLDYIEESKSFGEDEINILVRFAELASIAFDNARLYTAAQAEIHQQKLARRALKEADVKILRQNEYLACLHETALALMNRLELNGLLEDIITRAGILAGTKNGFVTLVDTSRQVTVTKVGTGLYAGRVGIKVNIGQGVCGKVWESGKPCIIDNYHYWKDRLSDSEYDDIQSIIGVPLKSGRQVIGVIVLAYPESDRQFTNDDIEFLNGFAKLASIALDNAHLYDAAQYLSLHDKLTGLYNRLFFEEEVRRLNIDRFYPVGVIACDVDGLKLTNDSLGHAVGDHMLKEAAAIIKQSFRQSDVIARIGGDEFSILLPNTTQAAVEAACFRIRSAIHHYNKKNLYFPLSISIGYAFSIESSNDIHKLLKQADDSMYREKLIHRQDMRSSIIKTLEQSLAVRDFIVDGHTDRLQKFVRNLAHSIDFPEQKMADLLLLAQFHDIGKIGIPDRILFKNGPLTKEESIEMQRHSEIGYRIANASPDLLPIAHCILKHHECWNGSGYPLGLRENEIPIECRILTIADAYDAMTSDRPYRRAMDSGLALDELKRCAGTQFDPGLVGNFIHFINQKALS